MTYGIYDELSKSWLLCQYNEDNYDIACNIARDMNIAHNKKLSEYRQMKRYSMKKKIEQLQKELDSYKQDGEIYAKVINYYGVELQKNKAIEECSELIEAIKSGNRENIKEEIVDVINMAVQLCIIYDIPRHEIRDIAAAKMVRTLERIEEKEGAEV